MTVEEWQDQLENVFGSNETVEHQIAAQARHERRCGIEGARRFFGYRMTLDRFLLFVAETLHLAETQLRQIQPRPDGWYAPLLMDLTTQFRRCRAAHKLFLTGYPLFGVALLRDVRDHSLLYAAILAGSTTVKEMIGADAIPDWPRVINEADYAKIRSRRKANQRKALAAVTKRPSGLSDEVVQELETWQNLFDEQVHGSLYTWMTDYGPWLEGTTRLPILPEPSPKASVQYVNRSTEVGWLFVRTLPILQLRPGTFGPDWVEKWRLLDLSFAKMTGDQIPIAAAVQNLVESKLAFDPESIAYPKQE